MATTENTCSYAKWREEMQEGLSEEAADVYVRAAHRLYHDDGKVEVDTNAAVQPVPDYHGAYVLAWVWVDDEEVRHPEKG